MRFIEESLKRIDNYFIAYHRTMWDRVQSIADEGFRPGAGAYGDGWYMTYDLESQFNRRMVSIYGDSILKCKINPKNLLVLNYNVAKDLFGKDYTLVDQLITHYKLIRSIREIPAAVFDASEELEESFNNPTKSAEVAMNLVGYNSKSDQVLKRLQKIGVRGIVFSGNQDGNVLLVYAHQTPVPLEAAMTNDDGTLAQDFVPIDNLKAINRASLAEVALEYFEGKVEKLEVDNYPIEDIKKNFEWIKYAEMKNASIRITDKGELFWLNGEWLRGTWKGDRWIDGIWKAGKWERGTFVNGRWMYGNFISGQFGEDGSIPTWEDGIWSGGEWVSGSWLGGEIVVKGRKLKSPSKNPSVFMANEEVKTMNKNKLAESLFLDESFQYYDLTPQEQDELFQQFQQSYLKATGASFSTGEFTSRAGNWLFFGETEGGIATRPQRSGLYKLVATWGSPRKIFNAFQEMNKEIGNKPIWGAMTDDLSKMLVKLSRGEFRQPPAMFVKMMIPHMKNVFGDVVHGVEKDGGIKLDTPAGTMVKYFVANVHYYRWILDQIDTNDRIPKIAKGPLKLALRKLAK